MSIRGHRRITPVAAYDVAAAGGNWTPSSLGANLVAWYTAKQGVYVDAGTTLATNGQTVEQWNDQSGNGNNLIQATSGARPTFNTATFNSNQGVSWNGSSTYMVAGVPFAETSTMSAFILFISQTGGAAHGRIFSLRSGGVPQDYDQADSWELEQVGGTTQQVLFYGDNGYIGNGGAPFSYAFNTPNNIGIVFNGSVAQAYVGFATQGVTTSWSNTFGFGGGNSVFEVGTYDGASLTVPAGVTAEMVITNSAMSGADIANLKAYTNTTWGTSF